MLSVFLSVLKVIGIILLSILLLVITLLLLLLFWPFFYKIDVRKQESFGGLAKISWLLHLVVVEAIYSDGFNLKIKIFGIPFYDKKKKDEKKKLVEAQTSADKKSSADSPNEKETPKNKIKKRKSKGNDDEFEVFETPENEKISTGEATEKVITENSDAGGSTTEETAEKKEKKPRKSFKEKITDIFERIMDFLDRLPDTVDEFCSKIESKLDSIAETIAYYDCLLSKKGTAWVIEFCKKELILILKHLKPYKVEIDVDHAAQDPEKVAKMYQYYGIALPFLPKGTKFISDFGEDKMHFCVKMKGRFFLFYLVFHVLKLILNKKVKKFIKLVKREDK